MLAAPAACERQPSAYNQDAEAMETFKELLRPPGGIRQKLASGTSLEVWFQDEMRVGQKNKLTYRHEGFTSASGPRSTHPIDLCVRCGLS